VVNIVWGGKVEVGYSPPKREWCPPKVWGGTWTGVWGWGSLTILSIFLSFFIIFFNIFSFFIVFSFFFVWTIFLFIIFFFWGLTLTFYSFLFFGI
jgi:hypothetical protein